MQRNDLLLRIQKAKEEVFFQYPKENNSPIVPPLFDSIKYEFNHPTEIEKLFSGERSGYIYSRYENPNADFLKKLLAKLTNRENCLLLPSGLAAIAHCLDSLSQNEDGILCFYESYSPTKTFIKTELAKRNIKMHICNLDDKSEIERIFAENSPGLCIFEQQTNPQLKIADREHLLSLCKQHDCITIADLTYDGFLYDPDDRIDVVIHSLSKFASGHSDIMAGSITSSKKELFEKMEQSAKKRGIYLDPYVCRQTARSLETYGIRHLQYLENAKTLAEKLEEDGSLSIKHPSLKSFPQKELSDIYNVQATTIYANLASREELYSFIEALKIIRMSPSLGCNESLIAPAKLFYGQGMTEEELTKAEILEGSFRISIGLESVEILLEDIQQALKSV